MKKTLLIFIGFLISLSGYSKSFRVGDFEYETDKGSLFTAGVILKKDYSENRDVIIPEFVHYAGIKYTVGSIDNNAFKDNNNVRSIKIPGSVYSLNTFAFTGLKNLSEIKVQPAIQKLDDLIKDKLKGGKKLPSFIPNLFIGCSTFADCESLETIDLSDRKTLITIPKNPYGTKAWGSSYPFENCKSLKTVITGDIVFSAENLKAFKGCHQLATVITGSVNPSKYENLFEKDCPFMTRVYPIISGMSEGEYLSYLNATDEPSDTIPDFPISQTEEKNNLKIIDLSNHNSNLKLSNDIMTVPIQRKDFNENVCALLKVMVPKKGLTFEGNVIGNVEYKNNSQYWVYVSPGTKKVRINVPGEKTKILNLDDYKEFQAFESKRIYEYSFEVTPTQTMNITYSPSNAMILIDGNLQDGQNGKLQVNLPLGEHSYMIVAKGYVTSEGIVKLTSKGESSINVNLSMNEE